MPANNFNVLSCYRNILQSSSYPPVGGGALYKSGNGRMSGRIKNWYTSLPPQIQFQIQERIQERIEQYRAFPLLPHPY